jgi:hypothetical protein
MKRALIAPILLPFSLTNSCNPKKPAAAEPGADDIHSQYVRRANADTVIVFVHGVFGGAVGTWTNTGSGAYWPKMLSEDPKFQNADVYVLFLL